jgi:hypothetical protein
MGSLQIQCLRMAHPGENLKTGTKARDGNAPVFLNVSNTIGVLFKPSRVQLRPGFTSREAHSRTGLSYPEKRLKSGKFPPN